MLNRCRLTRRYTKISRWSWMKSLPAEQVAALIRQTGGKLLREVRLFDVFRGGTDRRR